MINFIKSIFISSYTSLLAMATIHAAIGLSNDGLSSGWTGILIAVVPSLLFFVRLFASPIARTSANLNFMPAFAAIGSVVAIVLAEGTSQTIYTYLSAMGLGLAGSLLYVYWYSRLGRTPSKTLITGQLIPEFSLKNAEGHAWNSTDLGGHPALMLFFRGNWCPLCMAQIKEVAALYRKMDELGIKVYLVSPQPEKQTQALAKKFDVDYQFMIDEDNQAARILGIEALQGTPKGLEVLGYESDTVLPTAILTNPQGEVIYTDQTDNYRVRPEPETFIEVFQKAGVVGA